MDFQFQPGDTHLFSEREHTTPGLGSKSNGIGGGAKVYPGRGAGGKLRAVRRGSNKKATPYDRPASARHATSGGTSAPSITAARSSSSLASWLVGSASRLIASSASYFFPSLFWRNILTLPNTSAQKLTAEDEEEQEEQEPPIMPVNAQGVQENKEDAKEDRGLGVIGDDIEKEELNLEKVEDMLKKKTWSRDQVDRITELLKARIMEAPATSSREEEAAGQTSELAVRAVGMPLRNMEEATTTPISEAQRWREELKQARTDCMPIEVARAYMCERTSSRLGLLLPFPDTAHQIDRIADLQPAHGVGLAEDRYRSFPVVRSWARTPATEVRKRRSFLEEEWMSAGPVRKTRQKAFHLINSSPYARGTPAGETVLPRAHDSPPIQSSLTARKILDTLEMLSPSPEGKFFHEDCRGAMEASPMAFTPDILNIDRRRNTHFADVSKFSSLRGMGIANDKIEIGSLANFGSNGVSLSAEAMKESNPEDKPHVAKFLSSGKASVCAGAASIFPGFSATTCLVNSPTADPPASAVAPIATFGMAPSSPLAFVSGKSAPSLEASASVQSESRPLFSFPLPLSTSENMNLLAVLSAPAFASTGASSAVFATSAANSTMSTVAAATFVSPARSESQRRGTESQVRGEGVAKDPMEVLNGGSMGLPFGTPPFGSPFSFKPGSNTFPFDAREGQSVKRQAPASEAQSVSQMFSTSLPFSSTSTISSLPSFGVVSVSQPSPFPSFKPSLSGPLFRAPPSITKPSAMPSLTIEPSLVPFTFSPPPAPVSCSTPTFSFGRSVGPAPASSTNAADVVSSALQSSVLDSFSAPVSNSGPVFCFTSPSGGPILPTFGSCETSLPVPTFTFGSTSRMPYTSCANVGQTGSLPMSGQMFGSAGEPGSSTSSGLFGSGTVSGGSVFTFGGPTGSSFSPGQSIGSGAGSMAFPTLLTFGGQSGNLSPAAPLFGSGSGSASGAEMAISSDQRGLDFSTGLTSGEGTVERSGRRFLKAKRKK